MIRFTNSRIPAAFGPSSPVAAARPSRIRGAGQSLAPLPSLTPDGDQKFSLITLPIPDLDIYDPNGKVINPAGIAARSGSIKQWMDPDLAVACFAEARKQMDFAVAAANDTGGSQDIAGADALKQAIFWIMMGYNALNIPWYMDPEGRRLFRQFLAGPPQTHAGFTETAEFGSFLSYNDKWLVPGHIDPGFSLGSITQQMQTLIRAIPELHDPDTMHVPCLWPMTVIPPDLGGATLTTPDPWNVNISLTSGPAGANANDPTYADSIENFFVWGGFQDEQDFHLIYGPTGSVSRDWQHPAGPDIGDTPLNGVRNHTWRTFSWQNVVGNPRLVSTPMIFYVPWIDAWASSMTSRSPQEIVVASRLYTAYTNASKATLSGGTTNFVNQVASIPGLENQQATTGTEQDALRVTAAAVAAVGAALAGVTYGVSALIGGSIALALTIAGAQVRNTPHIARDDMGRFKPVLDRGWLAGNPTVDGNFGRPPISIPAPKGFTRQSNYAFAPTYGIGSFMTFGPTPVPTGYVRDAGGNIVPDTSLPWGWILGIAAGAVALYVGYKAMNPGTAPVRGRGRSVAGSSVPALETGSALANPRRRSRRKKRR